MTRHPIRRGQLIVPSGVGALTVFPDGVSLMVAGLDHWYSANSNNTDDRVYIIDEWRLRALLKVEQFRLPPDYRPQRGPFDVDKLNVDLKVPAVRFPLQHACARCNRLVKLESTERSTRHCPYCGQRGRLNQVQFIAMCERGHIQDFPFREWVHRTVSPTCDKPVQLFASGGASLLGVHVKCECGKQRNLAGITDADEEKGTSVVSHGLSDAKGEVYPCQALRPWLDDVDPDGCDQPLRGGLRSASNTYFAQTVSAIFVPQYIAGVPAELLDRLQAPPLSADVALLKATMEEGPVPSEEAIGNGLRRTRAGLDKFSAREVGKAVRLLVDGLPSADPVADLKPTEYGELRRERSEQQLKVRVRPAAAYRPWLAVRLRQVALIDKLR